MTRLHPAMASIERSYRAWLEPEATARQEEPRTPPGNQSVAGEGTATKPPAWITDAIRRHVATRPQTTAPASGTVIVLGAGRADRTGEDALPLVILLNENRGSYWSGWLVAAHPDYAGNQDVVLESNLLVDGEDPAPIAAMVQTWNRVHLHIPRDVAVLHRLKPEAMAAVRELSLTGIEPDVAPVPGRMHMRRMAGLAVITGTPHGRHDPRDPYLLLSRELADTLSEPLLERGDREYGDDEPEY